MAVSRKLRRWCTRGAGLLVLAAAIAAGESALAAARPAQLEALRAKAGASGGVRVLVELRVGAGKGLGSLEAGGDHAGAKRLRERIARTQEQVLDRLGTGAEVRHRYATIPWLALRLDRAAFDRLVADPAVGRVQEDRLARPHLLDSVPLIGADRAHASGFTGQGIAVAVLDTGVDAGHGFFGGRVVREACFSANGDCPNGQGRQEGAGAAEPCLRQVDGCEHGTHVAGIAAGNQGVAPGASILAGNVFSYFSGEDCGDEGGECVLSFTSDQVAGLEWVFSLRNTFRIAAVNMSLGGGQFFDEASCDFEDAATKAVIDNLRGVGIAAVISSGNSGFSDSLGSPGCISSAVAVGSTTKSDDVSDFSNSSTFLELLAPGSDIQSSVPDGDFAFLSGTSMAAPHVAGAWALLKQSQPNASVPAVLAAFQQSGVPIFDPRNGLVHPRIQVDDALEALGGGGGGGNCTSGLQTLCLLQGRFQVKVTWSNPGNGTGGSAFAVPASDQTGFYYFTDPANIELIIKILDFGDVVKVFYGQLTDLPFTITVTDTRSGQSKVYRNAPGNCGSIDQNGFPSALGEVILEKRADEPLVGGNCRPSETGLCLLANRFRVEVSWRNPYAPTQAGVGTANTLSNLAGYFTYLDPGNVELLVKTLDFGDRVLILYGAMSDFEYALRVTDTLTGQVRSYLNPPRTYCGGIDGRAFSGGGPTPTTLGEIESNDSTRSAQVLSGAAPLVVNGNVETFDVGSVSFRYNDGTRDDIEDLYRINVRSGGLVATISGHAADLDLFLINSAGNAIISLSNKSGAAVEAIELPDLAPGTYYLGVSIYDPSPVQSASRYSLLVNGGL
jgi:subtilisin